MCIRDSAWGVREGCVRDVALITRVGRTVCFTVQALDETQQPPVATLSRAQAQQMCKAEYLEMCIRDRSSAAFTSADTHTERRSTSS